MQEFLKDLFVRYYNDVYSYLYSLSLDAALSEDLTSEVFLEAVKSIYKFRGDSDIKTWLFSIARFRWYAHLRKLKKSPPAEVFQDLPIGTDSTPEADYIKKEAAERIRQLLSLEPKRTRQIVQMRMDGYSFYEIGITCGISESSARVIHYRIKTKIRQTLEKEGFENV